MENKFLTGASVLLFEKNCIVLFREKDNSKHESELCYTEPGGKYERKHRDIEEAAEDELYEETCCLFECDNVSNSKKNNFFDILYAKDRFFRVFMLDLPYLKHLKDDYFSNLHILQRGNADKHYLETDDVTRVYISDYLIDTIVKSENMNKVYVKDVHNKTIKLKKRTANLLYILFTQIEKENVKRIKRVKFEKDLDGLIHYIIH